jgi:hypothetical protein
MDQPPQLLRSLLHRLVQWGKWDSTCEASRQPSVFMLTRRGSLIAEFYLVDRGLRHRLPGFSSLDRRLSLRKVSAGSGTNGHTAVVALRGRTPGERGWFDWN